MSAAVFADTFYWIALAHADDASHAKAVAFDTAPARSLIVTTEEVLIEFLTFFGGQRIFLRSKALLVTRRTLTDQRIRVLPQTHDTFRAAWSCMRPGWTKPIALPIASPWRACGGKA